MGKRSFFGENSNYRRTVIYSSFITSKVLFGLVKMTAGERMLVTCTAYAKDKLQNCLSLHPELFVCWKYSELIMWKWDSRKKVSRFKFTRGCYFCFTFLATVKPPLSGHLRDLPKCPHNRGCPLNRGLQKLRNVC